MTLKRINSMLTSLVRSKNNKTYWCQIRLSLVALFLSSAAIADEVVEKNCPCPDTSDPVAVLRCVLDEPADGSVRGVGYCIAKPKDGYPTYPSFNFKRPNVYRAYRILSVTDGQPYKGQSTKRIQMEYDYVAQMTERHSEGKMSCKIWPQTVTAYQTDQGWLVSSPSNMAMEFKLKPLLDADQKRLEKRFLEKNTGAIQELSTRINTLERAAYNCALPPLGDWK